MAEDRSKEKQATKREIQIKIRPKERAMERSCRKMNKRQETRWK